MTEVVEPEATQQTEPIPDTQEGWEGRTDEERQTLLEDATNVADPTEILPEPETVPEEETPEPTPPVETAVETPEPAPIEETPETPAEPPKHQSIEDLQKANKALESKLGERSQELGDLRTRVTQLETPPEEPPPDPYAGIKPPDPFTEGDVERHTREVQAIARTEAAEIARNATTETLQAYEKARPVNEMIQSFKTKHPDLSPARVHGIALYADELANAARKSVSLDDAFDKMFPAGNNGEPPPVKPAPQQAPQTIADTPAATPPAEQVSRNPSQAVWNAKTHDQREAELLDIPVPPEGQ